MLTECYDSHAKYLNATSYEGNEQLGVSGGAEYIAMNKFPARLFKSIFVNLVLVVPKYSTGIKAFS